MERKTKSMEEESAVAEGAREHMDAHCHYGKKRGFGIVLIIVGLAFLLAALNILTWWFVQILWPIILIVIGIKMAAHSK